MKKLFWRYFLSIFALALGVLLIQTAIPLLEYRASQNEWMMEAYEDFVDSIEKSLADYDFSDLQVSDLVSRLSGLGDERISSMVFLNRMGRIFDPSDKFGGRQDENNRPEPKGMKDSVKLVSKIDVRTDQNNEVSISSYRVDPVEVVMPQDMGNAPPFGKVIISINGEDVLYIDLLTHTPMTYVYSRDIVKAVLRGLVVSIPACLVMAFVAAWLISSRNARYIDGVRKALKDLAKGKANVSLPRQRNSELNEISVAVGELDRELQANVKSRNAWLHSISHDLNTPTTAMKMIIEGLNDGVFPASPETFKELQRENDILSERIERVIEYSSLQADTKVKVGPVQSRMFVEEVLSGLDSRDIVETEVLCETMDCDSILMVRAARELLKNAIGNNGGEPVRWTVTQTDGFYEFDIRNRACLKTSVDMDMFEPWARGDWSRSTEGSGLGLPIALTIAALHNGSLTLEQESPDTVRATLKWPR